MKLETDRIGIELEVEDIPQRRIPTSNIWSVTHDASAERNSTRLYKPTKEYMLKGVPKSFSNGRRSESVLMGGELISKNPLFYGKEDSVFFENGLDDILKRLVDLGESPFSYRGSLHVHVNFPLWEKPSERALLLLKRTVKLGAHLEEMFFHLGGMGYKYRGVVINNSAYCRPITGKGPQVVNCETSNGMGKTQIFVLKDLLEATNSPDFFKRLGNISFDPGGVDRYHPARYTWLNLYSPLLRGTLEYRVFNKSLSRPLILSIVRLCQEVTSALYYGNLKRWELEENSIYDSTGSDYSHSILDSFIDNIKVITYLEPVNIKLLHRILDNSELVGSEFGDNYVYTHLRRYDRDSGRFVYSTSRDYCPPLITEQVLDSNFVDIHNMYGRR